MESKSCSVSQFNQFSQTYLVTDENQNGQVDSHDTVRLKVDTIGGHSGSHVLFLDEGFQLEWQRCVSGDTENAAFDPVQFAKDTYGLTLSFPRATLKCPCFQYGVYRSEQWIGDINGLDYGLGFDDFDRENLQHALARLGVDIGHMPTISDDSCELTIVNHAKRTIERNRGYIFRSTLFSYSYAGMEVGLPLTNTNDPSREVVITDGKEDNTVNLSVTDCDGDEHIYVYDLTTGRAVSFD